MDGLTVIQTLKQDIKTRLSAVAIPIVQAQEYNERSGREMAMMSFHASLSIIRVSCCSPSIVGIAVERQGLTQMSANRKILVADDDSRNRKLLETLLYADGYLVASVASGQAVLDAIATDRPDLILLDLMMPGMDGFEVVRRLKSDEG